MVKRWTVCLSHFPSWAEGPSCETGGIPERSLVMSKKTTTTTFNNNEKGWTPNTELGVDLKTVLRTDRTMQAGKDYPGVLRRDAEGDIDDYLYRDPHYTFVETLPWTSKRNPCLFRGKHISITRQDDGTLRPNFRPMKVDEHFTVDGYAFEVASEIRQALKGLVGK